MKRVTQADLPALTAYLTEYAEFNMFTLNNIVDYGLDGDLPRSPRIWMTDGPKPSVLCMTREGMVMPYLPNGGVEDALRVLLDQSSLTGMIGRAEDVRALQSACGLSNAPATMDDDEPQFMLHLDQMTIPETRGTLIEFSDAPETLMRDWMADYQRHTLHTPEDKIAGFVEADYAARCVKGSHKVLMIDGEPVAKTGFNAQLSDIVQIGGVYTPPALRGRGYARQALALHLAQARDGGVTRATLFSASDMAARAYRALGFQQIGDWTLLLFDGPQVAHV